MAKATAALYTPAQEQEARAIYNALYQSNDTFEQRIKVKKLKQVQGKEKTDKDGNIQLDEFGSPEKWDDMYQLTGGTAIAAVPVPKKQKVAYCKL